MRRWIPLFILLIAIGARLYMIDAQSLWHDEGNSLRLAERSAGALVEATSHDIHPPGYYLILKVWTDFTGTSELALRTLSALWGLITVAGTMALARRLFRRDFIIWLAGLAVAVNPLAIYYSQEARMYAQLSALSVLSLWLFATMIERAEARHQRGTVPDNSFHTAPFAFWMGAVNLLGLYTQYTFVFTLVVELILFAWWWLVRRDQRLLTTFGATGLMTLLAYTPWLFTAYEQVTNWPAAGDTLGFTDRLERVLGVLVYGQVTVEPALLILPIGLVLLALLYAKDWWAISLIGGLVLLSAAGLLFSGAYREANLKFLLPAQSTLAILLALGAVQVRKWPIVILLLIVGINAANLDHIYQDAAYQRSNYRAIANRIEQMATPSSAVILNAPNQQEVFSYYYGGPVPVYPLPKGLGGDDAATRQSVLDILDENDRIYLVLWGEQERDPNHIVEKTLEENAFFVSHEWITDVQLVQYVALGDVALTPAVETDTSIGGMLQLDGYTLSADQFSVGATNVLGVTLYWERTGTLDKAYRVSVQLLTAAGQLAAQGQDAALDPDAEQQLDRQAIVLPADLPAGTYQLVISVYDPDNPQRRLSPEGIESENDTVPLTSIILQSP